MELILTIIYLVVTGAVLFSMAVLLFRGEPTAGNKNYLVCQGLVVIWCTSQVLQMTARTKGELTAVYLLGNIGICFLGAAWFSFARRYVGKPAGGLWMALPLGVSLFHYVMVLTNPLHHLYYVSLSLEEVSHGPFFYTNVCSTYLLTIGGSLILYRNMNREKRLARRLVIASVLVPVALNAIYLTGLVRPSFDITPLGFAVSIVLVMWATLKYRFMNLKRELDITTEKLLLEKERNRIAQQVHDTVGHTLTMIQSYMKLAEVSAAKGEQQEVGEYLSQARILTGNGLRELRESINMLRREAECELVTRGIMQLAGQMKEIPVEVTIRGEDDVRYSHLSKVLYDTVRESMTNTLKYAHATKMDVIIRFQKECVELMIADDGAGCEAVEENNGIRGIRERIREAGGTVSFVTAPGEGFLTRVRIPV